MEKRNRIIQLSSVQQCVTSVAHRIWLVFVMTTMRRAADSASCCLCCCVITTKLKPIRFAVFVHSDPCVRLQHVPVSRRIRSLTQLHSVRQHSWHPVQLSGERLVVVYCCYSSVWLLRSRFRMVFGRCIGLSRSARFKLSS